MNRVIKASPWAPIFAFYALIALCLAIMHGCASPAKVGFQDRLDAAYMSVNAVATGVANMEANGTLTREQAKAYGVRLKPFVDTLDVLASTPEATPGADARLSVAIAGLTALQIELSKQVAKEKK